MMDSDLTPAKLLPSVINYKLKLHCLLGIKNELSVQDTKASVVDPSLKKPTKDTMTEPNTTCKSPSVCSSDTHQAPW